MASDLDVLPETKSNVFFWTYGCKDSWTDIREALLNYVNQKNNEITVKKYASEASDRIRKLANTHEKIDEWHKNFYIKLQKQLK